MNNGCPVCFVDFKLMGKAMKIFGSMMTLLPERKGDGIFLIPSVTIIALIDICNRSIKRIEATASLVKL